MSKWVVNGFEMNENCTAPPNRSHAGGRACAAWYLCPRSVPVASRLLRLEIRVAEIAHRDGQWLPVIVVQVVVDVVADGRPLAAEPITKKGNFPVIRDTDTTPSARNVVTTITLSDSPHSILLGHQIWSQSDSPLICYRINFNLIKLTFTCARRRLRCGVLPSRGWRWCWRKGGCRVGSAGRRKCGCRPDCSSGAWLRPNPALPIGRRDAQRPPRPSRGPDVCTASWCNSETFKLKLI